MELTRGKKAVKKSLEVQSLHLKKRTTPREDAQFWCEAGLDKDGFKRNFINNEIGFGLFAEQSFGQGDFLLEYVGTLLSKEEAEERSKYYARQKSVSFPRCFMYYFQLKGQHYCIDATKEARGLARFSNDAAVRDHRCNAKMKLEHFGGSPRLCLYAIKDISAGQEIRYDYGEDKRSLYWRENANAHPKESTTEDSDDDPFDVERDRENQTCLKTSSESEIDLCDMVDVSDIYDPDYETEESSSSENEPPRLHVAKRAYQEEEMQIMFPLDNDDQNDQEKVFLTSNDSDDDIYDRGLDRREAKSNDLKDKKVMVDETSSAQSPDFKQRSDNSFPLDIDVLWTQDNALDHTPLTQIGPFKLLKSSFEYLKDNLSDELIDAYMTLLVRGRNVLYIDSIDATNIFQGRPEKTNLLRREDLQKYDAIVAVVNENENHWVLLIILWNLQKVIYINPLGETELAFQEYCKHWYHFLDARSEEGLYNGPMRPWRVSTMNHDKQMDSVSCGIFVLTFAEKYLEDRPLKMSKNTVQIRREVGNRLLKSSDIYFPQKLDANEIPKSTCTPNYRKDPKIDTQDRNVDIYFPQKIDANENPKSTFTPNYRKDQKIDTQDRNVGENVCNVCLKVFKTKGALSTHKKSHATNQESYKKPARPCPFCEKLQTKLSRHIRLKHSDQPEVLNLLSMPDGSREQQEGFDELRKRGIQTYNKKQSVLELPRYMAERKNGTEENLVKCSKCLGFYKRNLFYRHKAKCIGDEATVPRKVNVFSSELNEDDEFLTDILSRFHRDEIGNICRSDQTLLVIGRRLFQINKRRVDKDMETRKSVMTDMRLLAKMYNHFLQLMPDSISLEDMFLRQNFETLELAIDAVTKDDAGKLKHGVKNSLYYLLKTSVDYLIGHHHTKKNDERASELSKFITCLEFHKDAVFGDAAYAIELRRLEKLRMPETQPLEEDTQTLRKHTLNVISQIISEYTFISLHEFTSLRDALCSRITLYNARRGGEPSRLKISHFQDAQNGRWMDKGSIEMLPEWEKELFKDHLVTYQPGKGSHLVPVLIPNDCVAGLDILCTPEIRERVKVPKDNIYLFPNTGFSKEHTSGWNATNKLVKEAGIKRPDLMNATKQRHRISTIYCSLDIAESDRQYFYKHMGHSKEVNWGTYQYPLPVLEVTKVGKHLQDIDQGTVSRLTSTSREADIIQGKAKQNSGKLTTFKSSINDASDGDQASMKSKKGNVSRPQTTSHEAEILQDEVELNSDHVTTINSSSDGDRASKKAKRDRDYFRWTSIETAAIKRDFKLWIEIEEGNSLPSTSQLETYIRDNRCRFTAIKLRTKIMNEQNKRKALSKKRMLQMAE